MTDPEVPVIDAPRPRGRPGRKPTPPDVRALRLFVREIEKQPDPARRAAAVRYLVGRYLPPEPRR
jgi:hypothetical protein